MKIIFYIFLILLSIPSFSQDKVYARSILDTLCSPHFDGRGYYNEGEKRAAYFIKSEYERIGLKPIETEYFQHFNLSVNSIKGKLELKINGSLLQTGKDYIVAPSSPSYTNSSEAIYLKKSQLTNIKKLKKATSSFQNKFVIIDQTLVKDESKEIRSQVNQTIQFLTFSKEVELNGLIELTDGKLTYSASQQKAQRPHITILKEKITNKTKEIELHIENNFDSDYQSQNVIGYIEGEVKDSFIYFVGHYDHLGRMGKEVYFPGANDNASGISMILSLAKELAQEEKPKYSVVFICFGSEEIGLVGSRYYTENPLIPLNQIKFLINLDILGTGDDGIQVVNGKIHQKEFDQLVELNTRKNLLKQVKIRGKACNSDHCFFTEKGVPSFFIYTLGGIAHYHNIYDKSETLPLTEYEDLFKLLKEFIVNI